MRVVIICPASTHTALVSSPSLTVLHLPQARIYTNLRVVRDGDCSYADRLHPAK